uniref:Chitin-binding type-2 domain-containing protein n=1 Tax=Stomoxys calcitrans TaxID=35570 RepID=A0A1I8QDS5_STOCA
MEIVYQLLVCFMVVSAVKGASTFSLPDEMPTTLSLFEEDSSTILSAKEKLTTTSSAQEDTTTVLQPNGVTSTQSSAEKDATTIVPCENNDNLCWIPDEDQIFACISETKYVLLINLAISYDCPPNQVCNLETKSGYCQDETLVEPTCFPEEEDVTTPKSEDITTTTVKLPPTSNTPIDTTVTPTPVFTTIASTPPSNPPPTAIEPISTTTAATIESTTTGPIFPEEICQKAGLPGFYKADYDSSCTKFVVCYKLGNNLRGIEKTCPPNMYFDAEKGFCSADNSNTCKGN